MADRGNIPNSPACGQWETLLADALDGLLQPEDEATFSSHMASCAACTALFEEARQGREWLEFLSPEPEVPEGLLDKILAQTGPGGIILSHDIHATTVAAMPATLDALIAKGYKFVTVSELIAMEGSVATPKPASEQATPPPAPKPYGDAAAEPSSTPAAPTPATNGSAAQ